MIFTSEHGGFTCKLPRTKWICRALKDFILNIYELLTHRNDRKSISNTDERNSAPIVEEHVRNKRRRFTTREIHLLCQPHVYILTRKNEKGLREREKESSCKGYHQLALLCDAARKEFNLAYFGGWLCARWARETFPWQLLPIFKVDTLVSVFTTDVGELKISVEVPDTLDLFKQWIIYILFSMHIYEDHVIIFYRTRFLSFHFLCDFCILSKIYLINFLTESMLLNINLYSRW